jgi:hypothetical protein
MYPISALPVQTLHFGPARPIALLALHHALRLVENVTTDDASPLFSCQADHERIA